jgi:superfamily II DNA or RNA helicase
MDKVEETQKAIYRRFKKVDESSYKTFRKYCFPSKFEYQQAQIFIRDYIKHKDSPRSLLIYHKIGSGKTCSAIQIAEHWKDKIPIYIVTPASLLHNIYKEFLSNCTGTSYISEEERKNVNKGIDVEDVFKRVKNIIDSKYNILSYNHFVSLIEKNQIEKNGLYIFDEIQNFVSENGMFYNTIYNFLKKADKESKIFLLSGTPIVDKASELALIYNLLLPVKKLPTNANSFNQLFINDDGTIKNKEVLAEHLNGYVSYYSGAPKRVFPLQKFKIVNCYMQGHQLYNYNGLSSAEKNKSSAEHGFYIVPRLISNISFPNSKMGKSGFNSLRNLSLDIEELKSYSIKYYKLLKKLQYSHGPVFIYSNFKEYGGLKSLIYLLDRFGYSSFEENGAGRHRYAVWSGDVNESIRKDILTTFNSEKNHNGSKIKILLGSPSIKEGVTLLRVRQVHIMEPHWNMSRIQQIIGRAVRFCSHKDLENDRRNVTIYLYLARVKDEKDSIDPYIFSIAKNKEYLLSSFEQLLYEVSIDKLLWIKR